MPRNIRLNRNSHILTKKRLFHCVDSSTTYLIKKKKKSMDLVMIEGFPFLEAYSPSMQDGPTIWMKMMLKFVIFEDSTSKLKLCTICKAQSSYIDV